MEERKIEPNIQEIIKERDIESHMRIICNYLLPSKEKHSYGWGWNPYPLERFKDLENSMNLLNAFLVPSGQVSVYKLLKTKTKDLFTNNDLLLYQIKQLTEFNKSLKNINSPKDLKTAFDNHPGIKELFTKFLGIEPENIKIQDIKDMYVIDIYNRLINIEKYLNQLIINHAEWDKEYVEWASKGSGEDKNILNLLNVGVDALVFSTDIEFKQQLDKNNAFKDALIAEEDLKNKAIQSIRTALISSEKIIYPLAGLISKENWLGALLNLFKENQDLLAFINNFLFVANVNGYNKNSLVLLFNKYYNLPLVNLLTNFQSIQKERNEIFDDNVPSEIIKKCVIDISSIFQEVFKGELGNEEEFSRNLSNNIGPLIAPLLDTAIERHEDSPQVLEVLNVLRSDIKSLEVLLSTPAFFQSALKVIKNIADKTYTNILDNNDKTVIGVLRVLEDLEQDLTSIINALLLQPTKKAALKKLLNAILGDKILDSIFKWAGLDKEDQAVKEIIGKSIANLDNTIDIKNINIKESVVDFVVNAVTALLPELIFKDDDKFLHRLTNTIDYTLQEKEIPQDKTQYILSDEVGQIVTKIEFYIQNSLPLIVFFGISNFATKNNRNIPNKVELYDTLKSIAQNLFLALNNETKKIEGLVRKAINYVVKFTGDTKDKQEIAHKLIEELFGASEEELFNASNSLIDIIKTICDTLKLTSTADVKNLLNLAKVFAPEKGQEIITLVDKILNKHSEWLTQIPDILEGVKIQDSDSKKLISETLKKLFDLWYIKNLQSKGGILTGNEQKLVDQFEEKYNKLLFTPDEIAIITKSIKRSEQLLEKHEGDIAKIINELAPQISQLFLEEENLGEKETKKQVEFAKLFADKLIKNVINILQNKTAPIMEEVGKITTGKLFNIGILAREIDWAPIVAPELAKGISEIIKDENNKEAFAVLLDVIMQKTVFDSNPSLRNKFAFNPKEIVELLTKKEDIEKALDIVQHIQQEKFFKAINVVMSDAKFFWLSIKIFFEYILSLLESIIMSIFGYHIMNSEIAKINSILDDKKAECNDLLRLFTNSKWSSLTSHLSSSYFVKQQKFADLDISKLVLNGFIIRKFTFANVETSCLNFENATFKDCIFAASKLILNQDIKELDLIGCKFRSNTIVGAYNGSVNITNLRISVDSLIEFINELKANNLTLCLDTISVKGLENTDSNTSKALDTLLQEGYLSIKGANIITSKDLEAKPKVGHEV